ncbi:hypothetical protein F66182_11014 [Fusarium sp. NRRL 66182]|nr:hypothetical protein F66182_11014 [Fusarium sp. NRRL 66182]
MDNINISRKRRFSDSVVECRPSPTSSTISTPIHPSSEPLPLRFGFELETMIRPKSSIGIHVPVESSVAEQRRFGFQLLPAISHDLEQGGFRSTVFDPNEVEHPDYSVWNVMLDGSLSKRHQRDGYYPVEIVSPILDADTEGEWAGLVDRLWRTLLQSFEFRMDSTCGFHIHTSFSRGDISMSQLRNVAKAVAFWEPATARHCPLSRQDSVIPFCVSNTRAPEIRSMLQAHGPLRGMAKLFATIDKLDRDEIVDLICPSKFFAWNFLPSRTDGHGSIEFRKPPGVISAKKAKHWIAFTLAFV